MPFYDVILSFEEFKYGMEWPISCQSGRTKNKVGFSLGTKTIHHYFPMCYYLNVSNTVVDCTMNSCETLHDSHSG